MVESLFRLENDRMVYMNWCQNVSFCLSKYKINKTLMHMLRPQFPSAISIRFFNQSIKQASLRKSIRTHIHDQLVFKRIPFS